MQERKRVFLSTEEYKTYKSQVKERILVKTAILIVLAVFGAMAFILR